jgi:hypothetical protein
MPTISPALTVSTMSLSAVPCRLAGAALARIEGRDHPPAAQDRGALAQAPHLFQLVRDVEDRAALRGEPVEGREQVLGLLRREHGGGLVQNQKLRVLQQAAHDFDTLPLAGRERPHRPVGLERETVGAAHIRELRTHFGDAPIARERDRNVLRHRQLVEQREVLEHHAEPERARLHGRRDGDGPALPQDLAGAGFDHAVEDLHQGRFAGPVLPEQGVDLARLHDEVDAVIRQQFAITLGDAPQLDEGHGGARAVAHAPRHQGISTVAPVVWRDSSARCASAAFASGRRE